MVLLYDNKIQFVKSQKLRECDLSSRSKNEIGLIYNRDYDHYEMSIDEGGK